MASICLLTDGLAQFASNTFRGFELINFIVPDIRVDKKTFPADKFGTLADFPVNASHPDAPRLIIPDVSQVCDKIIALSKKYDYVIAILSSRSLNPIFSVIEKALQNNCGKIKGQLINSQAIGVGLGYMLEMAAAAVMDGLKPPEIEHLVRRQIPHTYTALSAPGWSYLHQAGLVDHAQADAGDILGLTPIFTLEDGGLAPIQKVKGDHSIFEYFQEFLDEFDDLHQIAFLHHKETLQQEADFLREHVRDAFERTQYNEIPLNTINSVILGPRTTGLIAIEKTSA